MGGRRWLLILGLVLTLGLTVAAAGCGGGDDGDEDGTGQAGEAEPQRGGVLRVEAESFEWTGNFDPTGEYLGEAWGLYSNLLIRRLLSYRHVPAPEGNELIPDLAAEMPEVSEDQRTWTFRLKDGVRFSPPVDRAVTSRDIVYAFERIGTESLVAQYGFYYDVIAGMEEFKERGGLTRRGNRISGIETPDDRTIVFRLTQPTGDFAYRVAMPATGPIPREVARCFMKAGEYGRFVIATGPYMIRGSDQLDISSCRTMKPLPGFNPNKHVLMDRNPNYDAQTDTPEAREAFVDAVEIRLNTNPKDIFAKTKAGELDIQLAAEPPEVVREYTTNPDLEERYKIYPGDRTWYLTMNLTQPPFDDIHVRKAVNWVMDKEGLRRAWGGPTKGDIAHHIVPDSMFADELAEYAPYKTEGDAGDLEKAKEEMSQSKYDSDQDGVCDADVCQNILHVTRNTDQWVRMEPIIEQSLAKIGIEVVTREFEDAYTVIQDVSRNVPFASNAGWGKDYADPSTFMVLFDSRSINAKGNVNYSLVGITPQQARQFGARGTLQGIPNVDDRIDECVGMTGDERLNCWMELDRYLMEEVVPWVPYLDATNTEVIGPAVTKYEYDQFSGIHAGAHMAVDPEQQR